jgi:hypothetical protein
MKKKERKLISIEHSVLETLYTQASFILTGQGSQDQGMTPIYKRNYSFSVLHFGTLGDALYHPEKYTQDKRPQGDIHYMQNVVAKKEAVDIPDSKWYDLANAIDVLSLNGHVDDSLSNNTYLEANERKITLLLKGAIDFRNRYYLKEKEKENSIEIAFEIQKRDRWLKKYWYAIEIAKYIMGGVIGASIALIISRLKH